MFICTHFILYFLVNIQYFLTYNPFFFTREIINQIIKSLKFGFVLYIIIQHMPYTEYFVLIFWGLFLYFISNIKIQPIFKSKVRITYIFMRHFDCSSRTLTVIAAYIMSIFILFEDVGRKMSIYLLHICVSTYILLCHCSSSLDLIFWNYLWWFLSVSILIVNI